MSDFNAPLWYGIAVVLFGGTYLTIKIIFG